MLLIQLACLFIVGFLGESQKNQKILLAATPTVFLLSLACLFVSAYRRQRLFIWLEPASDPYGAGYQLGQMLRTFRAAGLWGAENAATLQDRLVLSKDPVLNALPYLARLWGNVTVAVCVALLLALMWILLRRVARLENPILRNGAFGVWVFLALTQLGGVCAPLGLLPMSNTWGLAFVGSQSLGGLLLLLAGVCWAAPAAGSGGVGAFLRRGFFCWRKETQSGVDTRLLADAWWFAARRRQGPNNPGAELPELPCLTHTGLVLIHLAAALEKAPSPDANLACGCAILHDAGGDTETTAADIEARFGARIAAGVAALTRDKSLGEAAMEDSLKRIQAEPPKIALVKLADRLAKLEEAPAHWTSARCLAYANESEAILKALGKASPLLAGQLRERIAAWRGERGSGNGGGDHGDI
jgi:hypothetical protein